MPVKMCRVSQPCQIILPLSLSLSAYIRDFTSALQCWASNQFDLPAQLGSINRKEITVEKCGK